MKKLKSCLRSTMGQSRLNHLMILNIYKELLDKMNLIDVAEEFVRENEHRLQKYLVNFNKKLIIKQLQL